MVVQHYQGFVLTQETDHLLHINRGFSELYVVTALSLRGVQNKPLALVLTVYFGRGRQRQPEESTENSLANKINLHQPPPIS